jgi:small subunit ribosomal protein S6
LRRTYELALVVDPRLSEEDAVGVVDQYKEMVLASGAGITKEESWGKRRLAYPIKKLTEGYYTFLYVVADNVDLPTREIEFRLKQNESVLRYMTIRTDEDLKRAVSKGRHFVPSAAAVGIGPNKPPEEPVVAETEAVTNG